MPLQSSRRTPLACSEAAGTAVVSRLPYTKTCLGVRRASCGASRLLPSLRSLPRPGRCRSRQFGVLNTLSPYPDSRSLASFSGVTSTDFSTESSIASKARRPLTRPDSMDLQLRQGSVVSSSGVTVLEDVTQHAFVDTRHSTNGALVLGLTSETGSVSIMDVTLGKLKFKRLLACARNKLWWMTPEWRNSTSNLPPETQFLLLELEEDGPYAVLLPLIEDNFRATLRPVKNGRATNGQLDIRVESGDDAVMKERWDSLLYIGAGWNPFELIDQGVTTAAALSGGALPLSSKQVPASVDLFGWCTWDAFYSSVSARGIQEGLASLKAGGINPGFLIIDDGWQLTDVDPPYGRPPTSQLADKMNLPKREYLDTTEDDFFQQTENVLSEAAKNIPDGSSAGSVMRPLANVGPQHHHPQHSHASMASATSMTTLSQDPASMSSGPTTPLLPVTAQERQVFWLVRLGQKVAGWAIGAGTALFLIFYQWVIEPSPPNSLANRWFANAAKGFLRHGMLSFYAAASDFTRRLVSVRANGKFSAPDAGPDTDWDIPDRLGYVASYIKKKFGVKFIYCWHGLPAYWAGVMPNALPMAQLDARILYAKPTPGVLEVEPSMAWNPAVLGGIGVVQDPRKLYNMMHNYLHNSAIDGVKVDCQAGVGLAGSSLGGGPALSRRFHAALEESVARYFNGNHCINCMCHSTENLYRMHRTAIARASDDFYPRDPASSHPHLAACAFNSLFLSPLVQPDWDMFHSKHPAAFVHAAARAISGGGVYVSDKPGEHDFDLLRSLVLPDGSILRCRQPARPTRDCLFVDVLRDGRSCMKLWNVNSHVGVVGVFNIQGSAWCRNKRKFIHHNKQVAPLDADVRARDVEPFRPVSATSAEFACFRYGAQQLSVVTGSQAIHVTVPNGSCELCWFSPVMQIGPVRFAAVGLRNMMNGGGAVQSCRVASNQAAAMLASTSSVQASEDPNDQHAARAANGISTSSTPQSAVVDVRGLGSLLMYSSAAPLHVRVNGAVSSAVQYDESSGQLTVELPKARQLRSLVEVVYA